MTAHEHAEKICWSAILTGRIQIRRLLASGLVAIAVIAGLAAGVYRYLDSHFQDSATFVERNSALAEDLDLREDLYQKVRSQVLDLADGFVTDPATANFGDGAEASTGADLSELRNNTPVTEETVNRDQAVEAIVVKSLESDFFRQEFSRQLTNLHAQMIAASEIQGYERLSNTGEMVFDLSAIYGPIRTELAANPLTAEIAETEIPAHFGKFKVGDRETTVDRLWTSIANAPRMRKLTLFVTVVALVGAVALAERRPTALMNFGTGLASGAVLIAIAVYLVRGLMPLLVGNNDSAPVTSVFRVNSDPLVSLMLRMIVLGVVISVLAWIARFIWPDEWVIDHVADHRGVQSVKRRLKRGSKKDQTSDVDTTAASSRANANMADTAGRSQNLQANQGHYGIQGAQSNMTAGQQSQWGAVFPNEQRHNQQANAGFYSGGASEQLVPDGPMSSRGSSTTARQARRAPYVPSSSAFGEAISKREACLSGSENLASNFDGERNREQLDADTGRRAAGMMIDGEDFEDSVGSNTAPVEPVVSPPPAPPVDAKPGEKTARKSAKAEQTTASSVQASSASSGSAESAGQSRNASSAQSNQESKGASKDVDTQAEEATD